MNIHNKYFGKIFSALCADVFPELFRIFPNFDISWYMTKDSEVHPKNCLLSQNSSISLLLYWFLGLADRVFAFYTEGTRIISRGEPFFFAIKTSEYSEIYREQLTSEHFLPYNYRSSTLPGISRNIGWLLRQCSCITIPTVGRFVQVIVELSQQLEICIQVVVKVFSHLADLSL